MVWTRLCVLGFQYKVIKTSTLYISTGSITVYHNLWKIVMHTGVSRRKRKKIVWRLLHLAVEMYNQHSNIGYFLHILLKYIWTHLFAAKVRIRCLFRPSSSPVAILYKMSPTMLVPPLGVRWWPRVLVLLGVLLCRESEPLQNIQWQA